MENGSCCNETKTNCCNELTTEPVQAISRHDSVGPLSVEQQQKCDDIRYLAKEFQRVIETCPCFGDRSFSDRCYSLALTALDQLRASAIQGVAFAGKTVV